MSTSCRRLFLFISLIVAVNLLFPPWVDRDYGAQSSRLALKQLGHFFLFAPPERIASYQCSIAYEQLAGQIVSLLACAAYLSFLTWPRPEPGRPGALARKARRKKIVSEALSALFAIAPFALLPIIDARSLSTTEAVSVFLTLIVASWGFVWVTRRVLIPHSEDH